MLTMAKNCVWVRERCQNHSQHTLSLVPGVHRRAERTPGFSHLRMRKIFQEIWETVFFWCSSVYGIRITVLF